VQTLQNKTLYYPQSRVRCGIKALAVKQEDNAVDKVGTCSTGDVSL
jgi:hypothetical protein